MSTRRNKPEDKFNTRRMMKNPIKYMTGKNWLDHSGACARVDHMLLEGASIEKLSTSGRKKSAIKSHINHLKTEHGLPIVNIGGVFRFDLEIPHASSRPAAEMEAVGDAKEQLASAEPAVTPVPRVRSASGEGIKWLFTQAENILREECVQNPSDDLAKQFRIIETRTVTPDLNEPDILNNLAIQASSYSVLRKFFRVLYPEDMANFDRHYNTDFFRARHIPDFDYREWEQIVLSWGNILLHEEGANVVSTLNDLVACLKELKQASWRSYTKQPRSRIILSLATALPKVKIEILANPQEFFDSHLEVSQRHPGMAYDLATRFSNGIIEMGNPLVCNFFKEMGLLHYVKVDVHVSDLVSNISLNTNLSKKEQFILGWLLAREAGMEPFFLDKILYVGGKYCKPQLKALFESHRADYTDAVNLLYAEIPAFMS